MMQYHSSHGGSSPFRSSQYIQWICWLRNTQISSFENVNWTPERSRFHIERLYGIQMLPLSDNTIMGCISSQYTWLVDSRLHDDSIRKGLLTVWTSFCYVWLSMYNFQISTDLAPGNDQTNYSYHVFLFLHRDSMMSARNWFETI